MSRQIREAAKKGIFNGPATKRGGGGKALPAGPPKKDLCGFPKILKGQVTLTLSSMA